MISRFLSILAVGLALFAPIAAQAAPTFVPNVEGTGQPGIDGGTMMIWNAPSAFDATTTFRSDRHIGTGTGTTYHTYKNIWALSSTNPYNAGFEWALVGELHNNALASNGAQNVAVNGTAFKETNGIGPVGPTWAGNFNCVDTTGEENPVASCIGVEIDVSTNAHGTDVNRQRVGLQISMSGENGAHSGYAIMMGAPNNGWIDRGIGFLGNGGRFQTGIDFTRASIGGAAILMTPGQFIALDGDDNGNFHHFIFYGGDGQTYLMTPGGAMLAVRDDGALSTGRVIEKIPHVPGSSGAACETGEHAWDANYEYRCISTNRWRRAPLSDF